MKNREICFIYPPSGRSREWEMSLGVNYIVAYLKKMNIESCQYISESKKDIDSIIDEVIDVNTKYVSFSCYDTNYYYIKLLCKKLKERKSNVIIIVGGPTATFSSDFILKDCKEIDFCIRGEGEITTYELIKCLNNNGNPDEIHGVSFLKNGGIVNVEDRVFETDIDVFPSPYINLENFSPSRYIIMTSGGCPFDCIYCNSPSYCKKQVRFHSVKRVVDELEAISKRNIHNSLILIGDDAFTLNVERARSICKEIIKKNIKVRLFCETRVDLLDEDTIKLLKLAGVEKIDLGLESSNPKVLRNIKKVPHRIYDKYYRAEEVFLEKVNNVVSMCKKHNISTMVNIIVGLPGETIEDSIETLDFVKKLQTGSYSHNVLRIYEGTEIHSRRDEFGYVVKNSPFGLPLKTIHNFDVDNITPLQNAIGINELSNIKEIIKQHYAGLGMAEGIKYSFIIDQNKPINISLIEIESIFSKMKINENLIIEYCGEDVDWAISMFVKANCPTSNFTIIDKNDEDEYSVYNYFEPYNKVILKNMKKPEEINRNTISYNKMWLINDLSTFDRLSDKASSSINPIVNPFVIVKNQCTLFEADCKMKISPRINIDLNTGTFRLLCGNKQGDIRDLMEFLNQYMNKSVQEPCEDSRSKGFKFQITNSEYVKEFCKINELREKDSQFLYAFFTGFEKSFKDIDYSDIVLRLKKFHYEPENLKSIRQFLAYYRLGKVVI